MDFDCRAWYCAAGGDATAAFVNCAFKDERTHRGRLGLNDDRIGGCGALVAIKNLHCDDCLARLERYIQLEDGLREEAWPLCHDVSIGENAHSGASDLSLDFNAAAAL